MNKDELAQLEQAFLQEAQIKASSKAKKAAINAATGAFAAEHAQHAQKKSSSRQGNADDLRLNKQGSNDAVPVTFSRWRNPMKATHILSGVVGVTVVALVVVNVLQYQNMSMDEQIRHAEEMPLADELAMQTEQVMRAENAQTKTQRSELVLADATPARGRVEEYRAYGVLAGSEGQSPAPVRESKLAVRKRAGTMPFDDAGAVWPGQESRDQFQATDSNALILAQDSPVSTFSIDVDTASYAFVRSSLKQGVLPPADAVRVEELINYFPYDYPLPQDEQAPFKATTTVLPTPWNPNTRLLHIGIKGYELPEEKGADSEAGVSERPRSNLVFLLDTSGSMNQPNKLPLLVKSFQLLLSTLAADDMVSIVTYAGSAGVVLEPTKAENKAQIIAALSQLEAGGSTAGGAGIQRAYQLAEQNFDPDGINRIILATDGDFNLGLSSPDELKALIARKRDSGVFLSVLGFGRGNYNDALMQVLAQNGNGNAAYIDSLSEARKVLLDEASSMLFTIAKDVKIQLEFNPDVVSAYRLIGYETRQLQREDFNNDKVDAGEIGAGHSVTAIYELTLAGAPGAPVDTLRYQKAVAQKTPVAQTEYGFLKLRYKLPDKNQSRLIEQPILLADTLDKFTSASDDVRFSVAVAGFGQLLRSSKYTGDFSYDEVIKLAQSARGKDEFAYRSGFIELLRLAQTATDLAQ